MYGRPNSHQTRPDQTIGNQGKLGSAVNNGQSSRGSDISQIFWIFQSLAMKSTSMIA